MTSRASRVLCAGAIAAALTLTGCSGGDSDAEGASGSDSSPSSQQSSGPSADTRNTGEQEELLAEAKKAGIDPANPPKPITSTSQPAVVKGDPKATLKIDLLGVKRQEKTVMVTVAFTVNATSNVAEERWLYHYLGNESWRPTLIDTKSLNLHKVVRAGVSHVQTDSQGPKFLPGQTMYAFALFAAPPNDVSSVDVVLNEGLLPIPAVPIS